MTDQERKNLREFCVSEVKRILSPENTNSRLYILGYREALYKVIGELDRVGGCVR